MVESKILFVPQTQRNFSLLRLYAQGLPSGYSVKFLRSTVFGSECDMGSGEKEDADRILGPAFMMPSPSPASWRTRITWQRKVHGEFKSYLRTLAPAVVVIGIDAGGLGRWAAVAACQCGIPTLCCQEGCTFAFDWYRRPWKLALKRAAVNLGLQLIFPAAMDVHNEQEFRVSSHAAVWGEYAKREIVRRRIKPAARVQVIGDPRYDRRIPHDDSQRTGILFVDSPFETWPPGVCDLEAFNTFRQGLVSWARTNTVSLVYKTHPLMRQQELDKVTSLADNISSIQFVQTGTADDWYDRVEACITFPSTAIFGILCSGTPLIQVHLPGAAYPRIYWDPVDRFDAGVTITSADNLPGAWEQVHQADWLNNYRGSAQRAALDAAGPADGKSARRFADTVASIIRAAA